MTNSASIDRPVVRVHPGKLISAALVSASGVLLFGFQINVAGYATLAAALLVAAFVDRTLLRHLGLIVAGLFIISLVPLNADLSLGHMAAMGTALALAVIVPWLVDRFVYRERIIRFPVLTGKP